MVDNVFPCIIHYRIKNDLQKDVYICKCQAIYCSYNKRHIFSKPLAKSIHEKVSRPREEFVNDRVFPQHLIVSIHNV